MIPLNTIQCRDCLEGMREMPDKSVDLVITSPPYNMGNRSLGNQPDSTVGQKHYGEYDDDKNEIEYLLWLNQVIEESLRISRYVFWNVQFVRSTRDHILSLQNEFKDNLKDIFIWEKQCVSNITAKNGGLGKGWEYVFLMGENNLSTFEYNNFPANGYVPNIQEWFKHEYFNDHHATFPIELPEYFIGYFTKEGDTVFDPFVGSGTTPRAAIKLNRNFIGTEIDRSCYDAASIRIKKAQEQGKIGSWFE
jgi:site-specific DNA-methyltransferase (adenine-specific)/modification methylase